MFICGKTSLKQQNDAQINLALLELDKETRGLLGELSRDFAPQFALIEGQAEQVHSLLSDAIEGLTDSFSAIENNFQATHGALNPLSSHIKKAAYNMKTIAGKDGELAVGSKDCINEILREIELINTQTELALKEMNQITEKTEQSIHRAVTFLQFQDMTSQLIGHMQLRLSGMKMAVSSLEKYETAPQCNNQGLQRITYLRQSVHEARDALTKMRSSPVTQKDMASGSAELF